MKHLTAALILTLTSLVASAAPPADAPAGTMGKCKDGSYSSSAHKQGACKGHKGVSDWYGTADDTTAAPSTAAPTGNATSTTNMTPSTGSVTTTKTSAPAAQAPGGGAGQVWVNSSSKVYHCSGDKWYGKTKAGSYMTEDAAKAGGNHADHGKACS